MSVPLTMCVCACVFHQCNMTNYIKFKARDSTWCCLVHVVNFNENVISSHPERATGINSMDSYIIRKQSI